MTSSESFLRCLSRGCTDIVEDLQQSFNEKYLGHDRMCRHLRFILSCQEIIVLLTPDLEQKCLFTQKYNNSLRLVVETEKMLKDVRNCANSQECFQKYVHFSSVSENFHLLSEKLVETMNDFIIGFRTKMHFVVDNISPEEMDLDTMLDELIKEDDLFPPVLNAAQSDVHINEFTQQLVRLSELIQSIQREELDHLWVRVNNWEVVNHFWHNIMRIRDKTFCVIAKIGLKFGSFRLRQIVGIFCQKMHHIENNFYHEYSNRTFDPEQYLKLCAQNYHMGPVLQALKNRGELLEENFNKENWIIHGSIRKIFAKFVFNMNSEHITDLATSHSLVLKMGPIRIKNRQAQHIISAIVDRCGWVTVPAEQPRDLSITKTNIEAELTKLKQLGRGSSVWEMVKKKHEYENIVFNILRETVCFSEDTSNTTTDESTITGSFNKYYKHRNSVWEKIEKFNNTGKKSNTQTLYWVNEYFRTTNQMKMCIDLWRIIMLSVPEVQQKMDKMQSMLYAWHLTETKDHGPLQSQAHVAAAGAAILKALIWIKGFIWTTTVVTVGAASTVAIANQVAPEATGGLLSSLSSVVGLGATANPGMIDPTANILRYMALLDQQMPGISMDFMTAGVPCLLAASQIAGFRVAPFVPMALGAIALTGSKLSELLGYNSIEPYVGTLMAKMDFTGNWFFSVVPWLGVLYGFLDYITIVFRQRFSEHSDTLYDNSMKKLKRDEDFYRADSKTKRQMVIETFKNEQKRNVDGIYDLLAVENDIPDEESMGYGGKWLENLSLGTKALVFMIAAGVPTASYGYNFTKMNFGTDSWGTHVALLHHISTNFPVGTHQTIMDNADIDMMYQMALTSVGMLLFRGVFSFCVARAGEYVGKYRQKQEDVTPTTRLDAHLVGLTRFLSSFESILTGLKLELVTKFGLGPVANKLAMDIYYNTNLPPFPLRGKSVNNFEAEKLTEYMNTLWAKFRAAGDVPLDVRHKFIKVVEQEGYGSTWLVAMELTTQIQIISGVRRLIDMFFGVLEKVPRRKRDSEHLREDLAVIQAENAILHRLLPPAQQQLLLGMSANPIQRLNPPSSPSQQLFLNPPSSPLQQSILSSTQLGIEPSSRFGSMEPPFLQPFSRELPASSSVLYSNNNSLDSQTNNSSYVSPSYSSSSAYPQLRQRTWTAEETPTGKKLTYQETMNSPHNRQQQQQQNYSAITEIESRMQELSVRTWRDDTPEWMKEALKNTSDKCLYTGFLLYYIYLRKGSIMLYNSVDPEKVEQLTAEENRRLVELSAQLRGDIEFAENRLWTRRTGKMDPRTMTIINLIQKKI